MYPDQAFTAAADRIVRRLTVTTVAGALGIHGLLLAGLWPDWRLMGATTLVMIVAQVPHVGRRPPFLVEKTSAADRLRMALNVAAFLVNGHLTRWALPLWLYPVLFGFMLDDAVDREVHWWHGGALTVVLAAALYDGCNPTRACAMVVLSALATIIGQCRSDLMRLTSSRLQRESEELARVHRELLERQQAATQQEKLSSLGLLAAGVAHEINNPMAYVTSNVSLLLQELRDTPGLPERLVEYRDDVLPATLEGARRVNTIVSDLRRFSKSDDGAPVECDLNDEVAFALRMARNRVKEGDQLDVQLGEVRPLAGYRGQLAQVALNLLVNAADALRHPGTVRVRTFDEEQGAVLVVEDDGEGMTPEVLARIFEPFFTTKPVGAGTGLGLPVVHGIVKNHGGKIEVESSPGRGTRVTVRLPRGAAAPARAPEGEAAA